MVTGKSIALTIQTFVDKIISLFYNMLSRFVIAFLPRSKSLLVSWLQSLWDHFMANRCHGPSFLNCGVGEDS